MTYQDIPTYKLFMEKLKQDLPAKVRMTDPYEWNKTTDKIYEDGETSKSEKAEAEKDESNDQSTVNEVEESVVTEERNSQCSDDFEDFAKEDTLNGL
uniref:ATP synthase subunit d, mitochondrial n=1 Tax=Heterorhabditis bacteriophora TaxID=37862 RepID=A0A1I7XL15_HETBA